MFIKLPWDQLKLEESFAYEVQYYEVMNMEAIELPYVKLLPTACTPMCAMLKSIGLDLYSPTSVLIPAHNKVLINMRIAFQIPMGYYGWIAPRLGLALHHHIHVGAGVVDPNYTGPVQVLLLNFSHQDHTTEANNCIAQLILERIAYPILCEVPQIPPTECCTQGFGSMGQ